MSNFWQDLGFLGPPPVPTPDWHSGRRARGGIAPGSKQSCRLDPVSGQIGVEPRDEIEPECPGRGELNGEVWPFAGHVHALVCSCVQMNGRSVGVTASALTGGHDSASQKHLGRENYVDTFERPDTAGLAPRPGNPIRGNPESRGQGKGVLAYC